MKKAGIREARQNLSALLEYVKRGHEIEITERGTTVARLVPACPRQSKPYRNHAAFRRTMPNVRALPGVRIEDDATAVFISRS